jgi:multidrug efflux system membrane fusion protein
LQSESVTTRKGRPPFRGKISRPFLWLAGGLILVAIIAWIIHLSRQAQASAQRGGGSGATAVAVATATTGDIAVRLPALGTVTPLATVTVKTQISGELQHIAFKEGQLVHEGDFLAQIDPRPYQSALEEAQGNLQRDQALLANARLDLKRYQEIVVEGLVAKQQVDTQQALVQQYAGAVATDDGQISAAKLNLKYAHIVAPVTGRVGLRQVDQGNYVTAGDANGIVVVTQLQPVSVVFPMPEDNLPAIQKRLSEGAVLSVEAYDRANTAKLADGTLQSVDNVIDTTTGTIKMRALFENQDGALFANQFVNIRLLREVLKDQVIIPVAAVQHGAPNGVNSTFVYLLAADHTVSVRPIVLGAVDGESVGVTSGLKAGDIVVTEGGDRLREGATVTLPQNSPAGGAAPASAPQGQGRHRHGAGVAPGAGGNSAQPWKGKPPGGATGTP